MKKSIFILATVVIAGKLLTSCGNPTEKANAEDNNSTIVEANSDFNISDEGYAIDIENYKKKTAHQVSENDKHIAEFKERIAHEKKEERAAYEKKTEELENKNSDMKLKMQEYKADGKDKWQTFKKEFSHKMGQLDASIKHLTYKHKNKDKEDKPETARQKRRQIRKDNKAENNEITKQ